MIFLLFQMIIQLKYQNIVYVLTENFLTHKQKIVLHVHKIVLHVLIYKPVFHAIMINLLVVICAIYVTLNLMDA